MAEHIIPITFNVVGVGDTAQEAQAAARERVLLIVTALCENNGYDGAIVVGGNMEPAALQFARRQTMDFWRREIWKHQHNEASRVVVPKDVEIR